MQIIIQDDPGNINQNRIYIPYHMGNRYIRWTHLLMVRMRSYSMIDCTHYCPGVRHLSNEKKWNNSIRSVISLYREIPCNFCLSNVNSKDAAQPSNPRRLISTSIVKLYSPCLAAQSPSFLKTLKIV